MSVQAFKSGELYTRCINREMDVLFYVKKDVPFGYEQFEMFPIAVVHSGMGIQSPFLVSETQWQPNSDMRRTVVFGHASDTDIWAFMRDWQTFNETLEEWVERVQTLDGLSDEEKQRIKQRYESDFKHLETEGS